MTPARTHPEKQAAWPQRMAGAFLVAIAVWLVVLGVFNLRHPSDWAMGDWLINYSGGFVRRGLLGAGAFSLQHYLGLPSLWTILLLQWSLYATVLVVLWRVLQGFETGRLTSWWVAAFLLSPATLAFPVLDPPFAFRKEILLFALMAITMAHFGSTPRPSRGSKHSLIGPSLLLSLGCGICVLAHEGLLVYFPYLFGIVVLGLQRLRTAVKALLLPVLVSVVLFALVSRYPGDGHVAQAVCDSIGGQITNPPSGICGGAIAYLSHSSAYAHAEVQQLLLHGTWQLIPWLFSLPFLPAVLGLVHLRRRYALAFRTVLTCAAVSGALSISLFFYGTDWTRWIYIHAFSLMLLMFFAVWQEEQQPEPASGGRSWPLPLSRTTLMLYALGWELTVYGQRPLYASFFRFVTHHLLPGKQ